MEIRIWLPESWSAVKYMLRHPRSFVIGGYGYQRWLLEHQEAIEWRSKAMEYKDQLAEKNERLRELGKQLSELKRKNN